MISSVCFALLRLFRPDRIQHMPRLIVKNIVYYTRRYFDSRFDRKYGLETVNRVELDSLSIDSANKVYGVLYEATPVHTFRAIIGSLPIMLSDYVFVDFGSGKGRVLIAAAEQGFKQVIGVEFSRELCGIAERNLNSYNAKRRTDTVVDIHCMDATEFEIPDSPCVLYLFNPFDRPVLERVVENIKRSYERNPRKIYIVHYNPVNTDLFSGWASLKKINTRDTVFELAGPIKRRFVSYEVV